ncbi:MAG: hypothetical protein IPQ07_01545 [Myxococcales bacterium]|nr:hypothetical protein [Myxococcales bacterium]
MQFESASMCHANSGAEHRELGGGVGLEDDLAERRHRLPRRHAGTDEARRQVVRLELHLLALAVDPAEAALQRLDPRAQLHAARIRHLARADDVERVDAGVIATVAGVVRRVELTDVLAVERRIDVERRAAVRVDEAGVRGAHLDVWVRHRIGELGAERQHDVAVPEHPRGGELGRHLAARLLVRGHASALLDRDDPEPDGTRLHRGVPHRWIWIARPIDRRGHRGLRHREVERRIEQPIRIGARDRVAFTFAIDIDLIVRDVIGGARDEREPEREPKREEGHGAAKLPGVEHGGRSMCGPHASTRCRQPLNIRRDLGAWRIVSPAALVVAGSTHPIVRASRARPRIGRTARAFADGCAPTGSGRSSPHCSPYWRVATAGPSRSPASS